MMLLMHIKGASRPEIAKEFRVSEKTIARTLSWAKQAQLLVEVEDQILSDLLPAAVKAVKTALASDTATDIDKGKLAIELFKGSIPGFGKKPADQAKSTAPGEDLASYINRFRTGEGVLDGEFAALGLETAHGRPALEAAPPATSPGPGPSPEIDGVGVLRAPGDPQGLGEADDLGTPDGHSGD